MSFMDVNGFFKQLATGGNTLYDLARASIGFTTYFCSGKIAAMDAKSWTNFLRGLTMAVWI